MVPSKKQLLSEYQRAQKIGKLVLMLESAFAWALFFNSDYSLLTSNLPEAVILVGLSVVPTLFSLAYHFAKKKKKVSDLKPTTKFGHLNKVDILDVCNTACNRMGIKDKDVSFYVTGDKQVNASALTLGLGSVFKKLQVVMLNRATLHALKKEELMSVVAHELAHIYRYPLIYQQALLLRLFNGALISLSLFTFFPDVFMVAIIVGVYQGLISRWFGSHSITIEFLCDDCGAEIAGVEPALRSEFLIAKHSEVLSDAYYLLLKAKREGKILNTKDLSKILEDSLSYDCVSKEELNVQIELNLKNHQAKVATSFFQHFKSQVFSDTLDTQDDLEDEYLKLEKSRKAKILELRPHEGDLSLSWFRDLITAVRASPQTPLLRTPNDISDDDSSHPGPRRRLLYLWQEFVERG